MQIDTHFPLAIYQTQCQDSRQHKDRFVKRIWDLRQLSGEKRTNDDSSWTGDIHNIDMLHADPFFEWLTQQVGYHALRYLGTLGHDLSLYDLYFQRSWPIISGQGQAVAPHTHPTAHLSAVYYVLVPPRGKSGNICFFNDAKPNDLFEGISSHMTNGYKTQNSLNASVTAYEPIEGRLLLFPSSCNHAVDANESGEARISISYDLMLTFAENHASDITPEFLLPSPIKWRRADKNGSPIAHQSAYIQPHYLPSEPPQTDFSRGKGANGGQGFYQNAEQTRSLDSIPLMHPLPQPTQLSRVVPPQNAELSS